YGPFSFFTDAIRGVNGILCGNQTSKGETNKDDFSEEVKQVLNKLQIATPKIPNYYAATKTQSIYAIAQCVETVSANSCHACLNRGFNDIQGCLPYTDGREYDAGCFMRYSHKPFFADNQIIDITPFLDKGDSRKKSYIIFGVLGGVALIIMVFFGLYRRLCAGLSFKKTMRVPKGYVKFGKYMMLGDDDMRVIFHSQARFFDLDALELFARMVDVEGSSGGSAPMGSVPVVDGAPTFMEPAIGGSLPPPPVPLRRFCPLPLAPPLRAGIHPKYFSPQSFLSDQNGGSQTFFHLYAAMPSACTTNTTCEIPGATKLKAPINYKYNDLKAATNNFNGENRLGGGGFGNVYKGTLKNGKVIAAKKLFSVQSKKLEDDFESEVKFLSNVHHRNLVRLLGFCKKGQERIIVYEYMTNGSLDKLLFGKKKGWLNWKQRYDMVLGTARGLAYLHEEFYVSIIHRDIKSGNILLDHELQPKISDFGLARFLPSDQSKLNTRFAGTLGYTAPEYAIYGQLSEKVDTYSYGIVILEIISGRKSTEIVKNNNNDDDDHEYLIKQ
ncbi:hypothetical protein S245_000633, partial [Arachis hypogaea]